MQCLPSPPQLGVSPASNVGTEQQIDNTGDLPIGNLASFMGRSSVLLLSLDSDIDDCRTPQISTSTEPVAQISQCPDLTQDNWMQCTSDNPTPRPLAEVVSDLTAKSEEGVNEYKQFSDVTYVRQVIPQPRVDVASDATVEGMNTRFRAHIGDTTLYRPPKIGLYDPFYVESDLYGQVQKTSPTSMCLLRPLLNTNIDHGRTPQISLSIERTTEVSQRPDPIRKQGTQSMRDEVIGQHVDVPAAASDPTSWDEAINA
ncbi:hypothetical protein PAXINDRAFT_20282 [Paxillus involutus ATCC 200175]|uniref:Uncharacterized protein n=1 Tax=Paxillus involutus ATCC 200175 TaxID=664439 RepID=A0A0C9T5C1_PAXIN|nr:hypothetical protein PAXINDRAFT_20282 [Paxillus involutus ATCC 200175]